MKVSKEQYQEWSNSRVTRAFLTDLEEEVENYKEELSRTNEFDERHRGAIKALREAINWEPTIEEGE